LDALALNAILFCPLLNRFF